MAVFTLQLLRSYALDILTFARLICSQSQQIMKIAVSILIGRSCIKARLCHSVMQMLLRQKRGTEFGLAIGHQTAVLSKPLK